MEEYWINPYIDFCNPADPMNVPDKWNYTANVLRNTPGENEGESLIGVAAHMVVDSYARYGFVDRGYLTSRAKQYAEAVEPPLSEKELKAYMAAAELTIRGVRSVMAGDKA